MKNRDTATTAVLRVLWSQIRNEEINKQHELTDEEAIAVAARQVKQLTDALGDFRNAGRTDLIEQTEGELQILTKYLPAQLSDDELATAVREAVQASGVSDIGKVMGLVMKTVKGKADGNRVRAAVEKVLAGS